MFKRNSIDQAIRDSYVRKYPLNHIAKGGNMDKDPIKYITNYEQEVLDAISSRAVGKSSIKILGYGYVNHREELDQSKTYTLEKSTFNLCYIKYEITTFNGEKMTFNKEFLLHQMGKHSDYWVRGIHLYVAPIVSDAIMHRKPDGSGILSRFRREKQIITPLNMKMRVNNNFRNVVISYNERPFKVITLSEKPGYSNKKKSPTILMSIYAKGLVSVLTKTYEAGIEDLELCFDETLSNTPIKDDYNLPETKDITTVRGINNTGVYFKVVGGIKMVQLATALLHVIDLNPILIEMVKEGKVNWEPRSQWLMVLVGKSIFHETIDLNSLEYNLNFHTSFVEAYMIETVKYEFERIGYRFDDIYDYYSTVFYEFDKIMSSNVVSKVVNNKRIESMYYLYSEIINKVNKEFEHALKDLADGNINRASKRIKGTIFRNSNTSIKSGKSLAIYSYTAVGDAFPFTIATTTALQEMGSGNDKSLSKEVGIDSVKDITPMNVCLGNAYHITNSSLNPMMTHNIHSQFEDDGTPILDLKKMQQLQDDVVKLYI